jgi:NAD+ kinase
MLRGSRSFYNNDFIVLINLSLSIPETRGAFVFKTVGVVSKLERKQALQLADKIVDTLLAKKLQVKLETNLAKHVKKPDLATPVEKMKTDLIITIGGDGTILRTCLRLPKPEPPILAVNMGSRGFLTEVAPRDALQALNRALEGKYKLERNTKLATHLGKKQLPDALNEVSFTSLAPAKLLKMRIWKDSELVGDCHSDGAVVASPTGSTGYSLSAGGPVIDPEVAAFVFTPIAPLTVFHPIVFSAKSTIHVDLQKDRKAVVIVDGHFQVDTSPEQSRVTITKSENETRFIRFTGDFYHRLKSRLLFSEGRRL